MAWLIHFLGLLFCWPIFVVTTVTHFTIWSTKLVLKMTGWPIKMIFMLTLRTWAVITKRTA